MLYSTPYGTVYGSSEQNSVAYYIPEIENAVGVIYAGSNMFYTVSVDGVISGVDITRRKKLADTVSLGEDIRMVGNGPAEAQLETDTMKTLIVGSESLWVCAGASLTCARQNTDFSMDLVERVEFLQAGVVYLKNGTTLVLASTLPSRQNRCLESETAVSGFFRLKPLYVDRYSPTGPGGYGYFLRDGKVYTCASDAAGAASTDYAKTYEDFVGFEDGAFWTALDEVKLTKPEASAGVTTGYRFKFAAGAAVGVRKDYVPPFRAWADESAEITRNNSGLCLRASGKHLEQLVPIYIPPNATMVATDGVEVLSMQKSGLVWVSRTTRQVPAVVPDEWNHASALGYDGERFYIT